MFQITKEYGKLFRWFDTRLYSVQKKQLYATYILQIDQAEEGGFLKTVSSSAKLWKKEIHYNASDLRKNILD